LIASLTFASVFYIIHVEKVEKLWGKILEDGKKSGLSMSVTILRHFSLFNKNA
jgi:hypothetical protein